MNFYIGKEEQIKIDEWMKKQLKDGANTGAVGGRFQYKFTPTNLGTVLLVKDMVTNQEIDVTDYESW
jgi:hypothetical protein